MKISFTGKAPQRATDGAAGYDLCSRAESLLQPNETTRVDTDLSLSIPRGYCGLVVSRSGLASRGVVVANSPGVIDSDYRGVVGVLLRNLSPVPKLLNAGDRIAQLLIIPVQEVEWESTEQLDDTARGAGGFGSTGIAADLAAEAQKLGMYTTIRKAA